MEYTLLSIVFVLILITTLITPYVGGGYDLGRIYLFAVSFLSLYLVIGAEFLSNRVLSNKLENNQYMITWVKQSLSYLNLTLREIIAYCIILTILIPYFLCTTGAMYSLLGVPHTILLHSSGDQYEKFYINDEQERAGVWSVHHGLEPRAGWLINSREIAGGGVLINKRKIIPDVDGYLHMYYAKDMVYDNHGSEVWL